MTPDIEVDDDLTDPLSLGAIWPLFPLRLLDDDGASERELSHSADPTIAQRLTNRSLVRKETTLYLSAAV